MPGLSLRRIGIGELPAFWERFDRYITELFSGELIGDSDDLDYFLSGEYRDTIESLFSRDQNPLQVLLFERDGEVIGFATVVVYLNEDGKAFVLEYGVEPSHRGQGLGAQFYTLLCGYLRDRGAAYVELTPSNERNQRFWQMQGLAPMPDLDEDGKPYWRMPL